MFMHPPWIITDKNGFAIGPRCGDCSFFVRDRRSPLYPDLEIYDCFSCPHACQIWSDGRRRTSSSSYGCIHFDPKFKPINFPDFFDPDELVGEQLTLF